MSYCVNCGVEMAPSQKVCPLCETEVFNPRAAASDAPQPFPAKIDIFAPSDDRSFIAAIVSIVLILPSAICFACDIAYTNSMGWSSLVVGAMAMLWVFIVPGLFIRRHRVPVTVVLDTLALLGYLWTIEHYVNKSRWVLPLALPIVLIILVLFIVDYFLITKVVRGRLRHMALAVVSLPFLLVGIEIVLDFYLGQHVSLLWSLIVSIPCLLLALLLLVIQWRQRFKDSIRKRFHV